MDQGNLLCVSFVNLTKQHLLATYPPTPLRGSAAIFKSGLKEVYQDAQKTDNNINIKKLAFQYHSVYYHIDVSTHLAVLVMVYEDSYPLRLVHSVIREMWIEVNNVGTLEDCITAKKMAFQSRLQHAFGLIFKCYDNAQETDEALKVISSMFSFQSRQQLKLKVMKANEKVESTMMQMMDSCASMEELHHRSNQLKKTAVILKKRSTSIKNSLGSRTVIGVIYVVLLFIIVAIYIAVPLYLNSKKEESTQ